MPPWILVRLASYTVAGLQLELSILVASLTLTTPFINLDSHQLTWTYYVPRAHLRCALTL
jgi:hypothetical protein